MCTAATYKTKDFYFGRTLDYEISFGDKIVITPRKYVFDLRCGGRIENHYAMIGISISMNGKAKDYKDVSTKLAETESWVYDVTRSVVQEYTYAEINDAEIQKLVKQEITKGLQDKYQTDCIYDVNFSQFNTQ